MASILSRTVFRMGKIRASLIIGALLLTASCSNAPDEDKWQQELAEVDVKPSDWDAYADVWVDACDDSDEAFSLFVAQIVEAGTASPEAVRINVDNACPGRIDDIPSGL